VPRCKRKARIRSRRWYAANREKARANSRESQARRRERDRKAYNKYIRLHRRRHFRKHPVLRVRHAFRNNSQARLRALGITDIPQIETLIGCTWREFTERLVPMLVANSWDWSDYGSLWVFDHALPLRAFNLHVKEELLACFNWRNLRPLSPAENAEKNGQFDSQALDIYLEEFCP
jgi:hypothetical protein